MPLTIHVDAGPLRADEYGVVRVGKSQVLLDVVVHEFNNGDCPETIAYEYPTLELADVYATIAYYLRHRQEVDEYIQDRQKEAEQIRQELEAKQPERAGLKEKLLARRAQMEREHASSGE